MSQRDEITHDTLSFKVFSRARRNSHQVKANSVCVGGGLCAAKDESLSTPGEFAT